jgi:hypothetical protein
MERRVGAVRPRLRFGLVRRRAKAARVSTIRPRLHFGLVRKVTRYKTK